jgi:hypothetical protein
MEQWRGGAPWQREGGERARGVFAAPNLSPPNPPRARVGWGSIISAHLLEEEHARKGGREEEGCASREVAHRVENELAGDPHTSSSTTVDEVRRTNKVMSPVGERGIVWGRRV